MLPRLLLPFLVLLIGAAAPDFASHPHGEKLRKLDDFTGDWRGTFRVFDADGTLADEIAVEQSYRWEGDVQIGRFRDTLADGTVVTADARNYVGDAGKLICEVVKSDGTRTVHRGTITGDDLFWHRDEPGIVEVFRERVEGDAYSINGLGRYGDGKPLLFHGVYRRPESD